MTVETTTNTQVARGNGATTSWPFGFKVLDAMHLVIQRRVFATGVIDKIYSLSEVTVTGVGDAAGGTVEITPALSDTYEVIISRTVPYKQELDIVNQGGFFPDTVEQQLDLMEMQTQQISDKADRAIIVPAGEAGGSLPIKALRANKFATYDSAGDPAVADGAAPVPNTAVNIVSDGPSTVQADLNARPTSAALASTASGKGAALVGFIGAGTGAVGRTLAEKAAERISPEDFGAVGDGATDDTDAFNAAIAYMNTLTAGAYLILTPGKNYSLSGSLDPFTASRMFVFGQGARITHDGGTLFTWGAGVDNGVVDGGAFGFDYQGAAVPTAGTLVFKQNGMNRLQIEGITGDNVLQFIQAGTGDGEASGTFVSNCRLTTYNSSVNVIEFGRGSNAQMHNLDMTASGASGVSRVLDETTLTGALATAIKFGADTWDTFIGDGLLINGYLYGFDVYRSTANKNVSNFRVSNFYFDYCSQGIRLENSVGGGGINNMEFVNGWVVGMDGYGVHLKGTVGSHRAITFTAVHTLLAGKNNWRLESSVMSDVKILGCTGDFANRLNGSNTSNDQDDFVAIYGGFACRDSRFGRSANNIVASSVPGWQGRYGFNPGPGMQDWAFENNMIEGATAGTSAAIGSTTVAAGTLYSSSMRGNRVVGGASKPAYATVAAVAAPTSGTVQTNNTPFHYELYFYGGTVTAVAKNSSTVADTVPARIDIGPGDTWSVTYTVAPTIKRVIKS